VLRPLPYKQSEQLVLAGYATQEAAPANFLDWRSQNQVFDGMAAANFWSANLSTSDVPERLQGFKVSANLFQLLGMKPALGRDFLPEEEQDGKDTVAILSNELWQRRFGADPNIVGKTISLNAKSYTVVGIMPPRFQFYRPAEIWSPLAFTPEEASKRQPSYLIVAARLKNGVTMQQAQADMSNVVRRLEQQYPQTNSNSSIKLVSLHEHLVGPVKPALLLLLAAVFFVLLIACANVANLLLARAVVRQKEMAIRAAMGASRLRIIRQLLTESILLGLLSGALGLLLAWWGIKVLAAGVPPSSVSTILGMRDVGLDVWLLASTLFVSLLTGIVFGLAPALQISKPDLNETLKEGGRGTAGSVRGRRLRSLLVVAEVSLSLMLLVGAGLLIKSFATLLHVNPGFDTRNTLTMQLSLLDSKYKDNPQIIGFYRQALEQIKNLPGVQHVGMTSNLPLGGTNRIWPFQVEGQPPPVPNAPGTAVGLRSISADYFQAQGVPLTMGRVFTEQDNETGQPVAVINVATAKRYWPKGDAIGKRLKPLNPPGTPESPWLQVVGVVNDIRHNGLQAPPTAEVYLPYAQSPNRNMTLVIRANSDPESLVPAVRNQILGLDKDQAIYNVKTMEQVINDSPAVSIGRSLMFLLASFAGIALVLAAVGIYSVMSYSVSQRQHEIGIFIALGAEPPHVLKMVVRQGMRLAVLGVVIGVLLAFAFMRLIASILFGVGATDLLTFVGTAVLLTIVAFLASYVPARRATRIDP
ncbi:MAG TPA: ABC transporter permease, partial [Pyrinomonadaceae bacterium]|nr:ABC transporter permease [Pyrinomonadaceae bacterium]